MNEGLFLSKLDLEEVGVFESLRTYQGKIFRLEEHLKRFVESARTAGLNPVPKISELKKELDLALRAFHEPRTTSHERQRDLFLRITVWKQRVIVIVGERKHPPSIYKEGVVLKTSPVRRTHSNASPAEAKTTAYQNAILATLEPALGTYEWIFLDAHGFLTEVRIGNLFLVKDGRILTPPPTGILNGVTRRVVIECSRKIKNAVLETRLTRHDLYNADEAFLTNTSWEILPIREVDGRKIGTKIPGPITLKLQRTFKQKVKDEIL